MARIKPGAASTRYYPKEGRYYPKEGLQEDEEYHGVGPDGMAVTTNRKKRRTDYPSLEAGIAGMERQGINRIDPKYATPSTAAGADEPPPTFDDKDWNLKTG